MNTSMTVEEKPSIPYVKNLDGLRALAIMLVLFDHWAPWHEVHNIGEFGRTGLLLFFILSGYLITTVLLTLRERMACHELSIKQALINFYMRRVLRIFPIYLLAILIAAYFFLHVRHDFLFHLFFLQNFTALWHPIRPAYESAYHLWSLAVEEQFYLLWAPIVLLLVSRRRIVQICIVAILVSLIYRAWCALNSIDGWTLRLIPLGDLDALAIGCLMAIDFKYRLVDWKNGMASKLKKTAIMSVIPILIITIAYNQILGFQQARVTGIYMLCHDLLMEIPLWLLMHSALHGGGDNLFSNRYLVWVGKKSYGIYVWHEFVRFGAMLIFLQMFNYRLEYKYSMVSFLIFISITFFAAFISWKFIEAPILKYKTKWS